MFPLELGIVASTANIGDYWVVAKDSKWNNYFLTSDATGVFMKSDSNYEKYSTNGTYLSNYGYQDGAGGYYAPESSKIGKDGYRYLIGYTYGDTSWLAKVNATTNAVVWQRLLTVPQSGTGPYGGYWKEGTTTGGFQFADLAIDSAGNVYVSVTLGEVKTSGLFYPPGSTYYNQFAYHSLLMKLDSNGNTVWTKLITASSLGTGWSTHSAGIMVDSADNPIVSVYYDPPEYYGYHSGILKFDGNGNLQWQKKISGPKNQGVYRMYGNGMNNNTFPADANIFVGGYVPQAVQWGTTPYVLSLNNSGTVNFHKSYGSANGYASSAYYIKLDTTKISGNTYSFVMWGAPFGQSNGRQKNEIYYGEIDFSSSTSANTVGAQIRISDKNQTVNVWGNPASPRYYDPAKSTNYIYIPGYTDSDGLLFKISPDTNFRSKTREISLKGKTYEISPIGEWAAIADSTTNAEVQVANGILNVQSGPSIGNASATKIASSGLVAKTPANTTYGIRRFS